RLLPTLAHPCVPVARRLSRLERNRAPATRRPLATQTQGPWATNAIEREITTQNSWPENARDSAGILAATQRTRELVTAASGPTSRLKNRARLESRVMGASQPITTEPRSVQVSGPVAAVTARAI